jgi:hypothetical protein
MRTSRFGVALLAAAAIGVSFGAVPASAASTISVNTLTKSGSSVTVAGSIAYGTDATGDLVLGTDATGDAVAPAPGLDLSSIKVRPDLAGRKLIWTLGIANGLPDPVGGPAPVFMGYQVPLVVDGEEHWRWLGAGTAGSAIAATGKWTGLCSNEVNGASGGWGCPGTVAGAGTYSYTGSISATAVSWTQPFSQMAPTIQYGSVVEQGSILCARPCSFAWPPGLVGAAAPVDMIDSQSGYKVPGEIKLAIGPVGSTPNFDTKATFNAAAGSFSGSVNLPSASGTFTVSAQTCYGLSDEPTCVVSSADITV